MNVHRDTPPPQTDAGSSPLRDLPLRSFHWLTVVAVTAAAVTGFLAQPWWQPVHVIAGYALGLLVAFRLLWGIFGSHFSRFRSLSLSPGGTLRHLREMSAGQARRYDGHNPAGTLMIVILLALLAGLIVSGLLLLGGQEKLGPLAGLVDFQTARPFREVHEIAAWILLGAVVLHLFGVVFETRIQKHPVLTAMITGKRPDWKAPAPQIDRAWTRRGAVLACVTALILVGAGAGLSALPAKGYAPVQYPEIYKTECADCHALYHPSLRTAAAWTEMMSRLDDHFGEDASFPAPERQAISRFLTANSAETFDTEASWRIGRQDTPSLRMTDTPYWKRRHQEIDDAAFTAAAVGSKVNCSACHRDGATGLFADGEIHLPERDPK